MLKSTAICFLILLSFSACYYDKGDKLYPNVPDCDTVSMNYNADVKPILTSRCLSQGCHTNANPNGTVILENYTKVTETIANDKLINALKYIAGGSKNMPPTGKLSDCEISKIEAWIAGGYPEN